MMLKVVVRVPNGDLACSRFDIIGLSVSVSSRRCRCFPTNTKYHTSTVALKDQAKKCYPHVRRRQRPKEPDSSIMIMSRSRRALGRLLTCFGPCSYWIDASLNHLMYTVHLDIDSDVCPIYNDCRLECMLWGSHLKFNLRLVCPVCPRFIA